MKFKYFSNMITKKPVSNFNFPTPQQFYESAMPQEFSFPIPVMKYIWSNPSTAEVYRKLIKCCKLFFIKKPILVIEHLEYDSDNGWKYCFQKECGGGICRDEHVKIDLNKIKIKIWMAKSYSVVKSSNDTLSFAPKLHRYDIKILKLCSQHLSYDELKYLASPGIDKCYLLDNVVRYENGEDVPIENIIQLFSGAKRIGIWYLRSFSDFNYFSSPFLCNSYEDFAKACNDVEKIKFIRIPDQFDVSAFYQSLKSRRNRSLIKIIVKDRVNGVDDVIDEILETKTFDFIPPIIEFAGQDDDDERRLIEIQETEAAKSH